MSPIADRRGPRRLRADRRDALLVGAQMHEQLRPLGIRQHERRIRLARRSQRAVDALHQIALLAIEGLAPRHAQPHREQRGRALRVPRCILPPRERVRALRGICDHRVDPPTIARPHRRVHGGVDLERELRGYAHARRARRELLREPLGDRVLRIRLVAVPREVQLVEHGREHRVHVRVIRGADRGRVALDLEVTLGGDQHAQRRRVGMQLERHALRRHVAHRIAEHSLREHRESRPDLAGVGSLAEQRSQTALGLLRARAARDAESHATIIAHIRVAMR
jgi:hypothetical protein